MLCNADTITLATRFFCLLLHNIFAAFHFFPFEATETERKRAQEIGRGGERLFCFACACAYEHVLYCVRSSFMPSKRTRHILLSHIHGALYVYLCALVCAFRFRFIWVCVRVSREYPFRLCALWVCAFVSVYTFDFLSCWLDKCLCSVMAVLIIPNGLGFLWLSERVPTEQ